MKEWEDFLKFLDLKKPAASSQSWRSGCRIDRFDAQNLYLSFTDVFSFNFFKEHITPELKNFRNANNHLIKVHTQLQQSLNATSKIQSKSESLFQFNWDKNTSFDQFVTDEDNRFVYEMLLNLQENTSSFNPFYIYGAKGSGKSHLLVAACNYYSQKGFKCLYVNMQTFSEHVVYAMRQSLMSEFRQNYRSMDMIFFDNIEDLAGKNATQEEFFHTFNTLHMAGKTIVIASATPASMLQGIEARLISRFEWGLSIELPALNKEHYSKLVESMQKKLDLSINTSHKDTLIEHFSEDPAKLSDAMHTMVLRSHLDNDTSSHHMHSTLEDLKSRKKELTSDMVVSQTAKFFGLKIKDIKGPSQIRPLAFPRQMAMYLIRKHLNIPYKKMGQYFDRDHSTVMASITIIEERLKKFDEETLSAIKRIEWELKN